MYNQQTLLLLRVCDYMSISDIALAGGGAGGFQASMKNPPSVLNTVKRTRNVFPETWLWSNVIVR
jgi:hypothetical protein